MGIYLSQPCTHVELEAGVGPTTNFGVGTMQGWRKNMEDAHVAHVYCPADAPATGFEGPELSVFGVFDGHGGKEVAIFAEHMFFKELLEDPKFKEKQYGEALVNCFHKIDALIETGDFDALLKVWKNWPNPSNGLDYQEFKKSVVAKKSVPANVLRYSVNLDDSSKATTNGHGGTNKKASRKDVEEMLANFLNRQTHQKPASPAENSNKGGPPSSPSQSKKKGKKNKKHKKKHRKGKKHAVDDNKHSGPESSEENSEDSHEEETDDDDDTEVTEVSDSTDSTDRNDANGAADSETSVNSLSESLESVDLAASSSHSDSESTAVSETLQAEKPADANTDANVDAVVVSEAVAPAAPEADSNTDVALVPPEVEAIVSEEVVESTVVELGGGEGGDGDGDESSSSSSTSAKTALTYKFIGGKKSCILPAHRIQAGCTAVVTLLVGDVIYTANAGDSRAVLCRGDGKAYELSVDHKPSNPVETARIENAGGFVSNVGRINGNLNLSRSLGDLKYKQNKELCRAEQMITAEPDITVTKVEPTDKFMIIGCDGIWDCLTSQQACDFVNEKLELDMKPTEIVTEILRKCLAPNTMNANGIGTDNMTCLVILLNQKFSV